MPTIYQLVHDAVLIGPDAPSEMDFLTFYASQDEAAVREVTRQRITWERWDQESSVSGVPAEEVKQRPDYLGGECYLIYIDGQLTYFQPHGLGEGIDPLTAEDLPEVAQAHVDMLVESLTVSMMVDEVRTQHARVREFTTRQEFVARQSGEGEGRKGSLG